MAGVEAEGGTMQCTATRYTHRERQTGAEWGNIKRHDKVVISCFDKAGEYVDEDGKGKGKGKGEGAARVGLMAFEFAASRV